MFHPGIVIALLIAAPLAIAQTPAPNFAELKAKHPVRVSGAEMRQLIPGAHVVYVTPTGSTQRWTNKPDGTLVVSSDGRGSNSGRGPASAEGTWTLDEKGRWCVKINWNLGREDWCRYLYKAEGRYYGYGRLEDKAAGHEVQLSH